MKRSPWLDLPARQDGTRPALLHGVVTEILDGGLVRVGLPAEDPQVEAVGPTDAGATAVGAEVLVHLSPDGKIQQVVSPREIPEDGELVATGVVGAAALEARELSGQESARIAQVEEKITAAHQAADDAAAEAAEVAARISEMTVVGEADPGHVKGRMWINNCRDHDWHQDLRRHHLAPLFDFRGAALPHR